MAIAHEHGVAGRHDNIASQPTLAHAGFEQVAAENELVHNEARLMPRQRRTHAISQSRIKDPATERRRPCLCQVGAASARAHRPHAEGIGSRQRAAERGLSARVGRL